MSECCSTGVWLWTPAFAGVTEGGKGTQYTCGRTHAACGVVQAHGFWTPACAGVTEGAGAHEAAACFEGDAAF